MYKIDEIKSLINLYSFRPINETTAQSLESALNECVKIIKFHLKQSAPERTLKYTSCQKTKNI